MAAPFISVIIPAYNEQGYINRALDSVMRQTYSRLETIVVANGCTDDTADVAFGKATAVYETDQKGTAIAKNIGAEHAQGDVLTFMDADSVMKEDLLEQVYYAVLRGYDGGKAKIRPLDDPRFRARLHCYWSELQSRLFMLTDQGLGAGAFTFGTRRVLDKIAGTHGNIYDPKRKVMEDVDILTRLKRHGRFKFITESCLYTSMRRFVEEGYWKCAVEDFKHGMDPENSTRERWE